MIVLGARSRDDQLGDALVLKGETVSDLVVNGLQVELLTGVRQHDDLLVKVEQTRGSGCPVTSSSACPRSENLDANKLKNKFRLALKKILMLLHYVDGTVH